MSGSPDVFLPAPVSDYDAGWGLEPRAAVCCPDCDETSPAEFEELGSLLAWVDAHIRTCEPGQ